MILKLAHISDVHLGAKFAYLGNRAEEHRNNIKTAVRACVDHAIVSKVDVFLIAGDLFDQPFPAKLNQLFVLEQIKKLVSSGIYVAIIAGNHDRCEQGSVYDSSLITQFKSDKLYIFKHADQETWYIPELSVAITGAGCEKQKSKNTPYQKLERNNQAKFNIGLFHGAVDLRGQPDNYPIRLDDLYASNFDYFALGDWHNLLDLTKQVPVFYSGSPEVVDSDQERAGYMLLVTLNEGQKAEVKHVKVGSRSVLNLKVDLTQLKSLQEIITYFKTKSNKATILNLQLTGLRNLNCDINREDLTIGLSEMFYHVNISDSSKFKISDEEMLQFSDNMIIGRYIKLLQGKKGQGAKKDQLIDEALQLGVHLLKGGQQ